MARDQSEFAALVDNVEASLKSAYSAQLTALEALRKLAEQADHEPGGPQWDYELDGTGFEDVPLDHAVFTVDEVADFLRVSRNVVYELVKTRRMPVVHLGQRIRITRRQLIAYMRGIDADQFDVLIKRRVDDQETKR
jgi:excisionase family DNA binding protein